MFVITFKELRLRAERSALLAKYLFTHRCCLWTHHLCLYPCDGGTRTARGGASVIGLARPQFCTTPFNRRQVCCLMWWNKGSWKESAYGERLGVTRIVYVFGGPVTHPSTNLHTGDGSKPGDWDTRWTSWRRIFDLDLNSPWSLLKQLEVKDHPLTGFF